MALTMKQIRAIDKPGEYGDGRGSFGLALTVRQKPDGSLRHSWTQKLRIEGKRTNVGLGSLERVTLQEARLAAVENWQRAKEGHDPRRTVRQPHKPADGSCAHCGHHDSAAPVQAVRTAENVSGGITFAECHAAYCSKESGEWSADTRNDWQRSFERYVFPAIGSAPAAALAPAEIVDVLNGIESDAVRRKTKTRIRKVLAWAMSMGHVERNAADGIDAAVRKSKPSAHHESFPWQDAAAEFDKVTDSDTNDLRRLLFEFVVLVGCRANEARLARWADIEGDTWTVPASETKTGQPYRFALSEAARIVIRGAERYATKHGIESEHVFATKRGKPVANSWAATQRDLAGVSWTHHGWRSVFADWAVDNGFERDLADKQLQHSERSAVQAAYFRTDRLEQRREMMEAWAAHLLNG